MVFLFFHGCVSIHTGAWQNRVVFLIKMEIISKKEDTVLKKSFAIFKFGKYNKETKYGIKKYIMLKRMVYAYDGEIKEGRSKVQLRFSAIMLWNQKEL